MIIYQSTQSVEIIHQTIQIFHQQCTNYMIIDHMIIHQKIQTNHMIIYLSALIYRQIRFFYTIR